MKKGKTEKGNQKPENTGDAVRATSVARGAPQKSLPTAPRVTLGVVELSQQMSSCKNLVVEPSQLGSLKGLSGTRNTRVYTGSAPYGEGKSLRPVEVY